ncbi:MAG: DUF4412 domain-containing protein [Candidatus Korobacteraceae bacterium]
MKAQTRAVFAVFSAVLLMCSWAVAQVPQLTPFSADVQVTSTRMKGSSQEMNGKVYVDHSHMRMDMTGGPMGGAIMITNLATKTTDTLIPAQHMYMEFNANQMQGRHPGMGPNIKSYPDPNDPCANQEGVTCKNLGVEQVSGRSCVHWQITDKNGKVGNVWIDQKLHFPIKATDNDSSWELTNIQEGQPAASLFEIPAGYQKMDMGSMMQGMRPPQQ